MKRLQTIFGLLIALSNQLAAGQPGLHREGEFWVETTSGSEAIGEGEQLRINSLGNVSVRGGNGAQMEYTVIRKVRARSEAQARDALQEAGVSLTRQGRYLRLVLNEATGPVDLQVSVPRILRALVIATDSGNVEAADLDGSVQAQTGAGNARLTRIKGSVNISTAGGTLHLGDIGGWARANNAGGDIIADSIGGEARFDSAGGDITVQKAGGLIRATTAGGKVRIVEAGGAVVAATGGGTIDIGYAGGAVTAHNAGGGPILVGTVTGSLRCTSASGAIKVGAVHGGMHIETASGSIVAQLEGGKLLSNSYVSTGSGDITVLIPSKLGVIIQADNDGATRMQAIVSEFPGIQVRLDGGSATATGELNGGGAVLHIEGTGGTIWIKKVNEGVRRK